MKGNQGLEALAALCGGQADAMTDSARNVSSTGVSSGAAPEILPSTIVASESSAASAFSERLGAQPSQTPLNHVSAQQWSQALMAAATLRSGGIDPGVAAQSLLLSAMQPHQLASALGATDTAFAAAVQQVALQQYLQAQAKLSIQQASNHAAAVQQATTSQQQQHAALMIALATGNGQHLNSGGASELTNPSHQKVIPPALARPSSATHSTTVAPNNNNGHLLPHLASSNSSTIISNSNMRPPPSPAAPPSSQTSSASVSNEVASVRILPKMEAAIPSSAPSVACSSLSGDYSGDGKKQMKRAANRKSAQLSRKRKKVFMEELKEENDELRRKEQILRAIPDLIVVFDSSGKLGFVSESVSRFFDVPQEDLEGTSFWDRLCDDSVRLLKAAFMDSLAMRNTKDSDSVPLGSGVWELRLVDKNSNYMIVTMNGVVHFTGEAPECVCCIRPRHEPVVQTVSGSSGAALNKDDVMSSNSSTSNQALSKAGPKRALSIGDFSRGSDSTSGIIPSQSVLVRNGLSGEDEVSAERRMQLARRLGGVPSEGDSLHRSGQVVRISDGDSVEAVSESCSDDGVASS